MWSHMSTLHIHTKSYSRLTPIWHSHFPSSMLTAGMQPWIRVRVELFLPPPPPPLTPSLSPRPHRKGLGTNRHIPSQSASAQSLWNCVQPWYLIQRTPRRLGPWQVRRGSCICFQAGLASQHFKVFSKGARKGGKSPLVVCAVRAGQGWWSVHVIY